MRLKIENFAKIKEAEIAIDGITVIAGENNTGKSTVGKILFSLFNGVSGIEAKEKQQRIKAIEDAYSQLIAQILITQYSQKDAIFSDYSDLLNHTSSYTGQALARKLSEILNSQKDVPLPIAAKLLIEEIRKGFGSGQSEDNNPLIQSLEDKITQIVSLPGESILLEILTRYFTDMFDSQINSLYDPETVAGLELTIREKKVLLSFEHNSCKSFDSSIALLNKAVYIDNPFLIDRLGSESFSTTTDQFLADLLTDTSKGGLLDGVIDTVLAKEKLGELYQALQSVVGGRIIKKNNSDYYIEKEGFQEPVSFHNLSTGLKSFVIVKMLLEKGALKEKDVLILDEPEIHLHPQWQIAYAELIVLLQKYFDLSIIVTTHSPYFLDALNLFSVKHEIGDKVNYYLSSLEDQYVKMTCVSDNIESIYQKMASPIQILDSLRYELNNN